MKNKKTYIQVLGYIFIISLLSAFFLIYSISKKKENNVNQYIKEVLNNRSFNISNNQFIIIIFNKMHCNSSMFTDNTECNFKNFNIYLKNEKMLLPIVSAHALKLNLKIGYLSNHFSINDNFQLEFKTKNLKINKNFVLSKSVLKPEFKNLNTKQQMKLSEYGNNYYKLLSYLYFDLRLKKTNLSKNDTDIFANFHLENKVLKVKYNADFIFSNNIKNTKLKIKLNKLMRSTMHTAYAEYKLPSKDLFVKHLDVTANIKNNKQYIDSLYNLYILNSNFSKYKKNFNKQFLGVDYYNEDIPIDKKVFQKSINKIFTNILEDKNAFYSKIIAYTAKKAIENPDSNIKYKISLDSKSNKTYIMQQALRESVEDNYSLEKYYNIKEFKK